MACWLQVLRPLLAVASAAGGTAVTPTGAGQLLLAAARITRDVAATAAPHLLEAAAPAVVETLLSCLQLATVPQAAPPTSSQQPTGAHAEAEEDSALEEVVCATLQGAEGLLQRAPRAVADPLRLPLLLAALRLLQVCLFAIPCEEEGNQH